MLFFQIDLHKKYLLVLEKLITQKIYIYFLIKYFLLFILVCEAGSVKINETKSTAVYLVNYKKSRNSHWGV
jgi:hypothetical protein